MGKSITPRYIIKTDVGIIGTYSRKPVLVTEVHCYIDSLKIGGSNEHLSKSLGYIPSPKYAELVRQKPCVKVIEQWSAPAFMVI